ncbi:transcription termination factor Rho [Nakamurella flavida]|uniref:transcription termination factor Rho n=1 Tax=Nakamurella flavida TaxID=363630 RepID=UPI00277DBAFA|nr:transcription termination factor Rho [Nakamurella flavida]MDP9776504.1 transcription termination factor Rho [Nakamurella flavida]
MTETTESLDISSVATADRADSAPRRGRRGEGLSGMVLTDLKALAGELGIRGTSGMRKGDLVAAITDRQSGSTSARSTARPETAPAAAPSSPTSSDAPREQSASSLPTQNSAGDTEGRRRSARRPEGAPETRGSAPDAIDHAPATPPAAPAAADRNGATTADGARQDAGAERADGREGARSEAAPTGSAGRSDQVGDSAAPDTRGSDDAAANNADGDTDGDPRGRRTRRGRRDRDDAAVDNGQVREQRDGQQRDGQQRDGQVNQQRDQQRGDRRNDRNDRTGGNDRADRNDRGDRNGGADRNGGSDRNTGNDRNGNTGRDRNDRNDQDDDELGGRRGRRFRDRNRRGRDRFAGDAPVETEVRDDDVLIPVAGILDVMDSYAFIRTSGYLTGPNDVYVSLSQVRKNGLRRGDAVTGAVRQAREGETPGQGTTQRQKFNALVRLDSVNGLDPETARNRPEFTKLTPLYPNDRLRLETESHILTTRVIDLVMPVGKGQRALIVSPPKAGKTMVMQAIANAITTNNPECHLMVVLIDERPEEVTDMQRSVKGEVIASTFDRPPADHTLVAELSIERAKRLVEMGRDVVVLLDSITRLGRAYNLAAPASGRILSGGVDSTALFPPKRFLGAARNIENGGSLTIFASALVETGSAGDTVIFEEFKGTGNAELKLDRRLADKRIFPAIDVDQSSTRKEDLLLSPDELAIVVKLRRVLSALDTQQAVELVLDRLRKTRNNVEFLMQVAKTTPGND